MKWKIYYGDFSTFGSSDGTPQRAPGLDVQVIIMENKDHGWFPQAGDDYYVWDCRGGETRWWGVDDFGMWEYLFCSVGYKTVKAGRRTSAKEFNAIMKRAMNDPDFPKKTSFSNEERRVQ